MGFLAAMGATPTETRNPMIGNQDPLYQNGNNLPNNNPLLANNTSSMNAGPVNNANPLAAIFSPSKSPTNVNAINLNLPVSSPKYNPNQNIVNPFNPVVVANPQNSMGYA